MTISPEVSIGDIISTLAFIATAIGLIMTAAEMRRNNRTQRAVFIKELYQPFFSDSDFRFIFERIELNKPILVTQFHGSNEEKALEKVLAHCELISALYFLKSLSIHDMRYFDYNLRRVCQNANVKLYLGNVANWCKRHELSDGPFSSVVRYSEMFAKKSKTSGKTGGLKM